MKIMYVRDQPSWWHLVFNQVYLMMVCLFLRQLCHQLTALGAPLNLGQNHRCKVQEKIVSGALVRASRLEHGGNHREGEEKTRCLLTAALSVNSRTAAHILQS